jgi:hypothetical protein
VVPVGLGAKPAEPARNEAPLADAGLDQQVQYGSTVRLDATGSRDPDGEIRRYEWTITRPNGTRIRPACSSCARTSFQPTAVGTYEVQVTVTDDEGATRSDTLYVEVEAGAGPSVDLTGPSAPTVGTTSAYTAEVSAGGQPVETIEWSLDGGQTNQTSASAGNVTGWFRFGSTEARNITVTVTDEARKTASDTVTVRPEAGSGTVATASGSGNDRNPDGQYSSRLGIWIEGDGADTTEEARELATGRYQELGPRDIGGLNDEEPWDGTEDVNADYNGRDNNDGSEETWDGGGGRQEGSGPLTNLGKSVSGALDNLT